MGETVVHLIRIIVLQAFIVVTEMMEVYRRFYL